jgi:small subunit ribosomal protein S20
MIKTLVKKARAAATPVLADVHAAIRALDAAARKGILHPNTAARKKSRLMRQGARSRTSPPA